MFADNAVTLSAALEEARRRGFSSISVPGVGTHQSLQDFAAELELSEGEDPAEYVIFGSFIVRTADAWKFLAEIYELAF